ncbi:MAG TPA: hypothetical protein VIV35_07995 [Chitinophagaceae bacterium]
MNTGFIVDEKNRLQEIRNADFPRQPVAIRLAAKIISYIFHPVFVPLYLVWFMVYIHPYLFAGLTPFDKQRIVIMAMVMYTLFPVVTVLLLKALKFIQTIQLTTQKDRIIPLVACGIWYFWICYIWWNSNKMDDSLFIPKIAVKLSLAIFLSSWLALMTNIIMKISLHAISMGVMLTFILLLAFSQPLNFGIYISVALVITGLVCTSRFIISDHFPKEVYAGLAVGAISMLIAGWLG